MTPFTLPAFLEPWSVFLAEDPLLRIMQAGMLLAGTIAVFLVFYTTRDILLRSNSFLYMFISIVLVAFLPVLGFFIYLLIRPARTLKEKETEQLLRKCLKNQSQPKIETANKKPKSRPKKDSRKSA